MNIDHIGFGVEDFKKSREFYSTVLAPLGLKILGEGEEWAMMGTEKCDIWFGEEGEKIKGLHLAFVAINYEQVNQFYVPSGACVKTVYIKQYTKVREHNDLRYEQQWLELSEWNEPPWT